MNQSRLHISKIKRIKKLRSLGFSIGKIRKLTGHSHQTILRAIDYEVLGWPEEDNDYHERILPFKYYINSPHAFSPEFLSFMPVIEPNNNI